MICNLLECSYDDKSLLDMNFLIDIYNTLKKASDNYAFTLYPIN
ncbi:MAG: hypothetical protein R3Y29_05260 [bacterium]